MDRDDDIERLFSWLQMPEVRYREFADARQMIPDTAALARAPEHALPLPIRCLKLMARLRT
jgi:hypothetical protein